MSRRESTSSTAGKAVRSIRRHLRLGFARRWGANLAVRSGEESHLRPCGGGRRLRHRQAHCRGAEPRRCLSLHRYHTTRKPTRLPKSPRQAPRRNPGSQAWVRPRRALPRGSPSQRSPRRSGKEAGRRLPQQAQPHPIAFPDDGPGLSFLASSEPFLHCSPSSLSRFPPNHLAGFSRHRSCQAECACERRAAEGGPVK